MDFHFSFWDVTFLAVGVGIFAAPIYRVSEELKRMNDRLEERDAERAAREDDD